MCELCRLNSKKMIKLVNGVEFWADTFFHITLDFQYKADTKYSTHPISIYRNQNGLQALKAIAIDWTNEFETLFNSDHENWEEKDYYDEIDLFLTDKYEELGKTLL